MPSENYLLCLRVYHYGGLVDYEEHTGGEALCQRLAEGAMRRPNVYQSRCTAYRFGVGSVVNAFNCGGFAPGWGFSK